MVRYQLLGALRQQRNDGYVFLSFWDLYIGLFEHTKGYTHLCHLLGGICSPKVVSRERVLLFCLQFCKKYNKRMTLWEVLCNLLLFIHCYM